MRSSLKKALLFALISAVALIAANAYATVEGLRVSTPDTCWYSGNFIKLPVSIEWTDWSRDPHCGNNEYLIANNSDYDPAVEETIDFFLRVRDSFELLEQRGEYRKV